MAGAGPVFDGPVFAGAAGFIFAATAGDGPGAATITRASAPAPAMEWNQCNLSNPMDARISKPRAAAGTPGQSLCVTR
jgi:hypothetical protein